jgi:hypothetical protein
MTVPTINMVTTTATTVEPTDWSPGGSGNNEVTTTTKLDFGTLNIDSNAWSAVKVVWAYVADMGGNTAIANMGFYCDGTLVANMTHYDKITSTWEDPTATGNAQQTGSAASGITAVTMHTVLELDTTATMEAVADKSQYIYVQYYVLSTVATGQKTTGAATGRPTFAFTYS